MKMSFILFSFFMALWCEAEECSAKKVIKEYSPKYAKLFKIRYYESFKIVISGEGEDKEEILVAPKHPDCTTTLPFITSQAKKFVATSTTHLPFLFFFELEKSLVGFQGLNYISHPKLRSQKIKEINYLLNAEELIALKPDLVMAYNANLPGWKKLADFRKLQIPIVFNWDFAEKHPLARAEWMIFSSIFFSKDELAIDFFDKIIKSYQETKRLALNLKKLNILVGEIQNGKWVTCGGESDLGIMIKDAGGVLLLDNNKSDTQFLALESVLKIKTRPDLWLPQNNWQTLQMKNKDTRYKIFAGVEVFNNNAKINERGFSDYWETAMARPDLLLKDLFSIFHPQQMPNEKPVWYKRLQ